MKRLITGYHLDEAGDWIAALNCGHHQHVRHNPPFTEREWTQSEEGRTSRLKTPLECVLCDRLEFPENLASFQRTPIFENTTIPQALLLDHATKSGIWAKIVVLQGNLRYVVQKPVDKSFLLNPETPGVIAPEVKHYIEPDGDVRFYVELYKL